MSINKTYAVFGLGRYGLSVAKELVNNGAEVIAVDSDENIINTVSNELPFCKCADTTDSEVLKRLGISNVDIVIVAMAGNIESSVMTVMQCKELGVPTVIAKCSNEIHFKILTKVGADKLELSFRKKYSLNVIAIKEKGKININIEPSTPLNEDMKLIVIGNKNKILKLK